MKKEVLSQEEIVSIPLHVFEDRSLSFLEVVVYFLKVKKGLSFREISKILSRDERTIWTVYHRAMKKKENGK